MTGSLFQADSLDRYTNTHILLVHKDLNWNGICAYVYLDNFLLIHSIHVTLRK